MPKHNCPYCACNSEGQPNVHPYIDDPYGEGVDATYCPECGAYQTEDHSNTAFDSPSKLNLIKNFPNPGLHILKCNYCGLTSKLDEDLPTEKDCLSCLQPLLPIHDTEDHGFHDWCHEDAFPNNYGHIGEDSVICKKCVEDKRRDDLRNSWDDFRLSNKWMEE